MMAFDRTEGSDRLVTIVNAGRSSFQVHEVLAASSIPCFQSYRDCQELCTEFNGVCVYMLAKALPLLIPHLLVNEFSNASRTGRGIWLLGGQRFVHGSF